MAKESKIYVSNKSLLEEFEVYWETGEISKKMTDMVILMCHKIANGRNFYSYPNKEDMKQEAIMHVLYKAIPNFKKELVNPFAYFSTVIIRKYIESVKREKRRLETKEIMKKRLKEEILTKTRNRY